MENFYNEHDRLLVSVDCIVFGFDEGELRVLMGKRKMDPGRGQWSLYGGFVDANESVDDAAKRVLYGLTGLKDLYMKQVGAYGDVDRDPGARVVSISYYSMINVADYDQAPRLDVSLSIWSVFSMKSISLMRLRKLRLSTSSPLTASYTCCS